MKKWIIAIVVILLFVVLYLTWRRFNEQDLGDNYYYLPEYEAIDIGYPYGAIVYKSAGRYIFSDVKIHRNVTRVSKDKNFIIAIQQDDMVNTKATQANMVDSNYLHFFIIVKETDKVYGPFSRIEYLKKREELKIPHSLRLKD